MSKPPIYAVVYTWPLDAEPAVHYRRPRDDTRLAREVLALQRRSRRGLGDVPCPYRISTQPEHIMSDTITIPTAPPRELLVSMAMRIRHDFGIDKPDYGDGLTTFGIAGMTQREREVLLAEMEQLYEEVVGKGFYRWDGGADQRGGLYALPLTPTPNAPTLSP